MFFSEIEHRIDCIVIGISAGGMEALKELLPVFPKNFPVPIIIVQHLHSNQGVFFIKYFNDLCQLNVQEAQIHDKISSGNIYFAPPNYHLMVEDNETFLLSIDPKVCFSRPAIDVLFESASDVYQDRLLGLIMTGANSDGALGLKLISDNGGFTMIQDPSTAEVYTMPQAARDLIKPDLVLTVDGMRAFFEE